MVFWGGQKMHRLSHDTCKRHYECSRHEPWDSLMFCHILIALTREKCQWGKQMPKCLSGMDLASMAQALPLQPMLCWISPVPCYRRTHQQACSLLMPLKRILKRICPRKWWMGELSPAFNQALAVVWLHPESTKTWCVPCILTVDTCIHKNVAWFILKAATGAAQQLGQAPEHLLILCLILHMNLEVLHLLHAQHGEGLRLGLMDENSWWCFFLKFLDLSTSVTHEGVQAEKGWDGRQACRVSTVHFILLSPLVFSIFQWFY